MIFLSVSEHLPRLNVDNDVFAVEGELPDECIISTRQVTRAPCLSLSRNTIMHFQTGKRYKTIRHC